MRILTKAESEIMQILWQKGEAFVQEIIDELPVPKPAYNTVSTIIRILEQKGVVGHEALGRSHKYFPVIKKEDYTKSFMKSVMSDYFGSSLSQMVSFFTKQENLSVKDLEEIKQLMESELNKQENKPLKN